MKSKIFVTLSLAGFASSAVAQNYAGPALPLDPGLQNQSVEFSIPFKLLEGTFDDVFTFEFVPALPCCSNAAASSVHVQLNGTPDISFASVRLNGLATTPVNIGDLSFFVVGPVLFDPSNSPAYLLAVSGFAQQGGTYGGTLNVAVVPELETYLMMLAGLAAVGFVAARRRPRD